MEISQIEGCAVWGKCLLFFREGSGKVKKSKHFPQTRSPLYLANFHIPYSFLYYYYYYYF